MSVDTIDWNTQLPQTTSNSMPMKARGKHNNRHRGIQENHLKWPIIVCCGKPPEQRPHVTLGTTETLAFSGEQYCLNGLHNLMALKVVDLVQVVDVSQDEVQVPCLTSIAQIGRTGAGSNRLYRCTTPAF